MLTSVTHLLIKYNIIAVAEDTINSGATEGIFAMFYIQRRSG